MESLEGKLYVGLDSEFFFENEVGKVIPAHVLLPGKQTPLVVSEDRTGATEDPNGKGIVFHYDGIQAEFAAAESKDVSLIMNRVQEAIKFAVNLAKENHAVVSLRGSIPVDIQKFSEYPPDAVEFGCDVDYISWLGGAPNPIFCQPEEHNLRYAGTHLHLGTPEAGDIKLITTLLEPGSQRKVVNVLDYLVGNTAVLLDRRPESLTRRKLYGQAGTYRPTPYGVEYRVLSSFLMLSPHWLPLFWALARESVRLVAEDNHEELFKVVDPVDIIKAINGNDIFLAKKNWCEIKKYLRDFFKEDELVQGNNVEDQPLTALEFSSKVSLSKVFNVGGKLQSPIESFWDNSSSPLPTWKGDYWNLFQKANLSHTFTNFLTNAP